MTEAINGRGWSGALALVALAAASCHGRPLTSSGGVRDASLSDERVLEAAMPPPTVVVAPRTQPTTVGRDCVDSAKCSWWQDPDPALSCCDGACANTHGDPWNCGACGVVCAADQICAEGKCRAPVVPKAGSGANGNAALAALESRGQDCTLVACNGGQICCGGACVDPSLDARNCGACGLACRFEGAGCRFGACCPAETPTAACQTLECPTGQVFCDPACKDLGVDPDNCGACGAVCPAAARTCVAGVCLSR